MQQREHFETVVIGGGQAGLSVGCYLKQQKRPFVILDAANRIGDSWRNRWDSLRLFTPSQFDGLPGLPFPAPRHTFPTKNEMADYLAMYARHFELPVRSGVRVDRLSREGSRYFIDAGAQRLEASHVVVAMATYQTPKIPACARELDPAITQLHSRDYCNPAQLAPGDVLIVGAGNSGAELAVEIARTHRTWLAGRDTGHVPFRINGLAARALLPVLFRVVFHRVLTVDTPPGRKARHAVLTKGGPLIRVKPRDLAAAGVIRVPRLADVRDGRPRLQDDLVLDVRNVIWCTGFHGGFDWIDLPVVDERGEPRHERGIVPGEPGLYFVGLHFLYSFSSTMIHGVGRDAERIARAIAGRLNASPAATEAAHSLSAAVR